MYVRGGEGDGPRLSVVSFFFLREVGPARVAAF